MSKLGSLCVASVLSFAFSGMANATTILAGNTTGTTFSSCTGCATSSTTELTWNGGTLTNDPLTFSATGVTAVPLQLAELQMTVDNNPSGTPSFNYNLVLAITTPALPSGTYVFDLGITTGGTGVNSNNNVTNLVFSSSSPAFPTSINLGGGFELTNFGFDAVNVNAAGGTSFSSGEWSVTGHQGQEANLFLVADVVSTLNNDPIQVPEPASLMIFGSALLAFPAIYWARKK